MPGEIDELAVVLTANGRQFAEEVDAYIEQAREGLGTFAEEVENLSDRAFRQMTADAREAAVQTLLAMRLLGQDLEGAMETVQEMMGYTQDQISRGFEVLALEVEGTLQNLQENLVADAGFALSPDAMRSIRSSLEDQIMTMEELTRSRAGLKEFEEALDDYAERWGVSTKMLDDHIETNQDFIEALQILNDELVDQAIKEDMVRQSIEKVTRAYEKQGEKMPLTKQKQMQDEMERIVKAGEELNAPLGEINQNIKDLAGEYLPGAASGFDQLIGKASAWLQGLAGIGLVITAFTKLKELIRESIALAAQLREEERRLELATNMHQRAVGELSPTLAEVNERVEELTRLYGLNEKQARNLVQRSLNLTRDLDLTTDQMWELQEASYAFGQALGIDAQSVMQRFTNFLNTGYSQGLQELGFSIEDHTLLTEALKRGYIEFGEELDDVTKRMVGMEIITEQAGPVLKDLEKSYSNTEKALEDTNEALNTQKEILGTYFLPAWEALKSVGNAVSAIFISMANEALKWLDERMKSIADNILATQEIVSMLGSQEGRQQIRDMGGPIKAYREIRDLIRAERQLAEETEETFGKVGQVTEEEIGGATKDIEEFKDKLILAQHEFAKTFSELSQKYEADADRLERTLDRNLAKITADFNRRRKEAGLDLAQDLRDIDREAARDRLEEQAGYHKEEERALEDHRIKMERLEKDYLWNLQDAVRERDARAVLELRRRYKRQRNELEEDFDLQKKRRQEDFQQRMAEIERQRQIERNERINAFNAEIMQLAEQEKLKKELERERFNERLRELNERYNERLRIEGQKLAQSLDLNVEHANELAKILEATYGNNGLVVGYIQGIMDWLSQANLVLPGVQNYPSTSYMDPGLTERPPLVGGTSITSDRRFTSGSIGSYYGRQRGGTMFATSPQLIQVGETPERIDFTRLSASTGAPRERRGGGGERIGVRLQVDLGDGLVGEVIDQTMGEMAEVFVNISGNNRRSMGRR